MSGLSRNYNWNHYWNITKNISGSSENFKWNIANYEWIKKNWFITKSCVDYHKLQVDYHKIVSYLLQNYEWFVIKKV